eukprot:6901320-Prymnesium_polylepis.1
MRQGCKLTVRSPALTARSESVVYEFSGQSFHENLSVTCKGHGNTRQWLTKSGQRDERTTKRRGGRPHGRRSAAAP